MLRSASRVLFVVLFLCTSVAAWADAITDRAKLLLQRKDPDAAYKLLEPLEDKRAGDPEFDYLLGLAALDTGHYERAIFALERVLAVQPDNLQARAEIARAYMATGELATAKRELEAVKSRQVPDEVRRTIDQFLSAIQSAETTQYTRYLELGFGYDSNINAATASTSIAIPSIGPNFQLAPSLVEQSDRFIGFAAGFNFTRKLNLNWAVVGGIDAFLHQNLNESTFDTAILDGSLGMRYARGLEAVTVGLQGQQFMLDSDRYRTAGGGIAQWQHNFDERRQASVFGQYTALRYQTQPIRNADRSIIGLAYAQAFDGAYSPALFTSVYGGEEAQLDDSVPQLGNKPLGARLGGQVRLGGGWGMFAGLAYEHREYNGVDP
ncbi:MAG TPA: tetratricopeptide repeat protein, partial [Burkholderiales bacterium]|nr:tetratricopeptide repeat protein [Burkholderiales bacterium]